MKAKVLQREVFVRSAGPGIAVLAASYYCSRNRKDLLSIHKHMSRSDTADITYVRRSSDGGRTWTAAEAWPTRFEAAGGTGRRHPRGGHVDLSNGRYVDVWTEGVLPNDEPLEGMKRWTLHYSVSEDGGKTTRINEPVIQDGPGFDESHPLPGVTVGRNCVMIGDLTCRPLTLSDGTILMPVQSTPTGPDGNYHNPGSGYTYTDTMVLRGRWRPDGRIAWEASERVKGDPALSTRGMIEPTVVELADSRILMVMRGSNDRKPELQGRKWCSFSKDGGRTWTPPVPWAYTDGQAFYSPSACSQLVPHSSGKLFWIGNICEHNPVGNLPRYPIVLAEVDITTGGLIRDSVSALDDRQPGENERLTLSNFYVREDRDTGDLLLHMTRLFAKAPTASKPDWTADALLYRIDVG